MPESVEKPEMRMAESPASGANQVLTSLHFLNLTSYSNHTPTATRCEYIAEIECQIVRRCL
jgi:hypothetical protein